ncbi:hypothetical protein ACI1PM_17815, partial [Ralstonia nicotianae]|uniref:hypothetical protein n=1 Tax=Ralstonia nicotianae TaxID=3037696 RepID=UPI0039A3AA66
MQGQGVLFGQVGVVFGIVIAGVWIATQWTAAALGYQLRLGMVFRTHSVELSHRSGAERSGCVTDDAKPDANGTLR